MPRYSRISLAVPGGLYLSVEVFWMRTKLLGGIGVVGSIAASVVVANAADMAVKSPFAARPVILSDWAGFYIGINGGGGWGTTTFDGSPQSNGKPSGGLFGGHAGYNWQHGSVVAGLEADIDGADIKQTVAGRPQGLSEKTDELATARARLGYAIIPGLLAYGTAGAAWGHSQIANAGASQLGWAAGAGLEYKVWGNIIARAEYLHYGFDKTAFGNNNVKESIDTLRGGLSYKF
jgi:outer membrane immunogenic protein